MNHSTPLFLFFILIIGLIPFSYAVQSGGYTTIPLDIEVDKKSKLTWYLLTKNSGIHTITATGNGVPFAEIPQEIELQSGRHTYYFEILIPKDTINQQYTIDLHIVQKETDDAVGGSVVVQAAKKIFLITPIYPEIQTVTAQTETKKDPPVKPIQKSQDITIKDTIEIKDKTSIKDNTTSEMSSFDSPSQQVKNGILAINVQCNDPLQLYIRDSVSPVCLYPDSYEKLVEYGLDFSMFR